MACLRGLGEEIRWELLRNFLSKRFSYHFTRSYHVSHHAGNAHDRTEFIEGRSGLDGREIGDLF